MVEVRAFNHVALKTRRLEASRRFYVEVMGARVISRPPFDFEGCWLYVGGVQIHLIEDAELVEGDGDLEGRVNHVAFSVADIGEAEARLREMGVRYRENVIPGWGVRQLFFCDPNGWRIELGSYRALDFMAADEWDGRG